MRKRYLLFICFLTQINGVAQTDSTQFEKDYAFVIQNRYNSTAKEVVKARVEYMQKNAKTAFEKGLAAFAKIMSENSNHLGYNMGQYSHILTLKALNYFIEARNRHYQKLTLMEFSNDYEVIFNLNNRFKSSKSIRYATMAVRFDYDPDYLLTEPIYDDFTDREVSQQEMQEVIEAIDKSYQYAIKINNLPVQMYRLQKLGGYKFYVTKKFEDIEIPCLKSLAIAQKLKDNFKTFILGDLCVYANNAKEHQKAIKYAEWGYVHSRDTLEAVYSREGIFLHQLYEAHKALGNYEKAIGYQEKANAIVEEKYIKNESKKNELFAKLNQELQKNLHEEKQYTESRTRQFWLLGGLALLSIVLVYVGLRNRQLKDKNAEISAALLQGQTIERKRVAADLHDNLGSMLSAIKWSLQAVDKSRMNAEEQTVHQNLVQMLSDAYNQVRLLSHNLLPEEFEKQGLGPALQYFVRKINQNKAVQFELKIDDNLGRLDKKTEFELYSICLELANNILKHAHATQACIDLKRSQNEVKLTITDNGRGFFENNSDGKGIQNVKARVESLNGKWNIQTSEKGGVSTEIVVPV